MCRGRGGVKFHVERGHGIERGPRTRGKNPCPTRGPPARRSGKKGSDVPPHEEGSGCSTWNTEEAPHGRFHVEHGGAAPPPISASAESIGPALRPFHVEQGPTHQRPSRPLNSAPSGSWFQPRKGAGRSTWNMGLVSEPLLLSAPPPSRPATVPPPEGGGRRSTWNVVKHLPHLSPQARSPPVRCSRRSTWNTSPVHQPPSRPRVPPAFPSRPRPPERCWGRSTWNVMSEPGEGCPPLLGPLEDGGGSVPSPFGVGAAEPRGTPPGSGDRSTFHVEHAREQCRVREVPRRCGGRSGRSAAPAGAQAGMDTASVHPVRGTERGSVPRGTPASALVRPIR
ncbi:hypothetical protein CYFUS_009895 [Cystobacter fuscus]|uniref:Uncharacterized protein n=1 Tax=Cystobacter fuscus TaxID=43 RepID=A0A250JL92_9BACT|nr:hypothetical protein CYFUS_009895 [Cystobacter fuscus]